MLRDMELMLNTIYDQETKIYLSEALNCYNARSYKACVIMSVIAGMYDLHSKVKELASSDLRIKDLDDKVEKKKRDLEVYEKFLIEQCATEDIDMLNGNEAKELLRCLDTRNDCAHPSNFVCSPEKARDIFTSIIDILASKPILLGCRHMTNLVNQLEENSFFPVKEESRMKMIVESKLSNFHSKAYIPLQKLLVKSILNPKSKIHKNNMLTFLAYSLDRYNGQIEILIGDLIDKDQYENELLDLIDKNPDILDTLNGISRDKLKFKLKTHLETEDVVNIDSWIKVILNKKMQSEDNQIEIANMLTAFKEVGENDIYSKVNTIKYDFILKLVNMESCSNEFRSLLKRGSHKKFSLNHYSQPKLIQLLTKFNEQELFEYWIGVITSNLYIYDFNVANRAVDIFRAIDKNNWINLVSTDVKYKLVKEIIKEGSLTGYHSHGCEQLLKDLPAYYPELIEVFVEELFRYDENFINVQDVEKFLDDDQVSFVLNFVKGKEEILKELIVKFQKCKIGLKTDTIISKIEKLMIS